MNNWISLCLSLTTALTTALPTACREAGSSTNNELHETLIALPPLLQLSPVSESSMYRFHQSKQTKKRLLYTLCECTIYKHPKLLPTITSCIIIIREQKK